MRQPWVLPCTTSRFRRGSGNISETWDLSSLFFCFWFYFKLLISCLISIYGNTYTSMLNVLRTFLWCWRQLLQTHRSPNSYSSGQKSPKSGHIQTVCSPDLCQLLNHDGYSHGDSLGQKHVKSYANNLSRQLQCLGLFPGHPFMMEDVYQTTLVGHIQKDPKTPPPKWHYSPGSTWLAAIKTLLQQFAHPVLRP